MKTLARFSISFAAVVALTAGLALADGSTPIRHLTYNFEVTLSTTSTVHDSGIGGDGPASGSTDYHAGTNDQGTITVDVMQVQPDTGLVVQVTEHAHNSRNNVPTLCVVYGNGATVCDQSKGSPNEEEMNLLRFLGQNFVNSALMDAHKHWQYSSSDAQSKETNDYTISSDTSGTLGINYQRVLDVSGVGAFNATTDGSLTYNQKLSVPTSVKEETTTRRNTGAGNYDTVKQQMSFTLAQDSMQQAAQTH